MRHKRETNTLGLIFYLALLFPFKEFYSSPHSLYQTAKLLLTCRGSWLDGDPGRLDHGLQHRLQRLDGLQRLQDDGLSLQRGGGGQGHSCDHRLGLDGHLRAQLNGPLHWLG